MPKNKRGGKSSRKGRNSSAIEDKQLITKNADGGQEYAKVMKMLGNCRITTLGNDDVMRLCKIPGKFKRPKIPINVGDIVLINLREYETKMNDETEKAEVAYKYDDKDIRKLRKTNCLNPKIFDIAEKEQDNMFSISSSEDDEPSSKNNNIAPQSLHKDYMYPSSDEEISIDDI